MRTLADRPLTTTDRPLAGRVRRAGRYVFRGADGTGEKCNKAPCGHLTQVLWGGSTKIGCGRCYQTKKAGMVSSYTAVFCEYAPRGNFNMHRADVQCANLADSTTPWSVVKKSKLASATCSADGSVATPPAPAPAPQCDAASSGSGGSGSGSGAASSGGGSSNSSGSGGADGGSSGGDCMDSANPGIKMNGKLQIWSSRCQ